MTEEKEVYITLGAKRALHRMWTAYAILAVATVVGIWAFTARSDRNLKSQINDLSSKGCVGSIATYHKFNDLVFTNIKSQKEAMKLNLEVGQPKRAAINKRTIKQLRKDLIVPPTAAQCGKPILK